jgi:hypothetical protein
MPGLCDYNLGQTTAERKRESSEMLAAKDLDIVCSLTTNAYVWSKCSFQLHGLVLTVPSSCMD